MNFYYILAPQFSFGGTLLLLHEIYNLNHGNKNIKLIIKCKKSQEKLFNINKFLDSKIKIEFGSSRNNYINLNKIIEKKQDYSFSYIYKNFKKVKFIKFKEKYIKEVKAFLKLNNFQNFFCVHLKKDENKTGSANILEWKKFINYLAKKKKIIILNSSFYNDDLKDIPNVFFVKKGKKNIFFEPIMLLLSKAFFGNASGFCTFANFSHISYLILKNSRHHINEFKGETKKNRLLFAKKKQLIIRNKQNFKILIANAKKIIS